MFIYKATYQNNIKNSHEEKISVNGLEFWVKSAEMIKEEFKNIQQHERVSVAICDEFDALKSVKYLLTHRNGKVCVTGCGSTIPCDFESSRKYMTFVGKNNAYRFYEMVPYSGDAARKEFCNIHPDTVKALEITKDAFFKAAYGRMAVEKRSVWDRRTKYYPMYMYWVKYAEKINEGYSDISKVYYAGKKSEKILKTSITYSDTPSGKLFETLYKFSKKTVESAQIKVEINDSIIKKSWEILGNMRRAKDVDSFNSMLMSLMGTLQRPIATGKGCGVIDMLAKDKSDFKRIVQRETDLIQSMEGVSSGVGLESSFDHYGIEVWNATKTQKEEVIKKLSVSLQPKVKHIYRVIPKNQKQMFDEYLKRNNIQNVQRFWHGSRNENWLSIMKNSLKLNPDAIITGKMFGDGIYFAPSSMKSWGYTSIRGSYWAGGNSNSAFMGLYLCASGKPYDVYAYHPMCDYKAATKKAGCDSLFAHKGISLRNDEVVFYDENAVCLQYIVEFAE